jgi:pimeloyl-ACP methyl ester carboxylesterase
MEDIDLRSVHVPALVVWGDKDQWVDGKTADRLVNELPDGRLVRLPGAGRLVPEENPEQLADLLLEFIKRRAVA